MKPKFYILFLIFVAFFLFIITGISVYILVEQNNIKNEINVIEDSLNVGLCKSDNEINGDGKETVTLKCGDKLLLTVDYKASTGYSPFPPVFDSTLFELLESPEDKNTSNGMPGGDNSTRTFIFKSLKEVVDSNIELGIYRSFNPETTKTVQKNISVTVE